MTNKAMLGYGDNYFNDITIQHELIIDKVNSNDTSQYKFRENTSSELELVKSKDNVETIIMTSDAIDTTINTNLIVDGGITFTGTIDGINKISDLDSNTYIDTTEITDSLTFAIGGVAAGLIDSTGWNIYSTGVNQGINIDNTFSVATSLNMTNSASTNGIRIGLDSNRDLEINNRDNLDINFSTNDTEQMKLDNSGNLTVNNGALTVSNGNIVGGANLNINNGQIFANSSNGYTG